MANEEEVKINLRRDAFASIAIWQIAAFIFLLCLVWFNELLDIPAMMFGAEPTPFSLYRACLLSAAVITGRCSCHRSHLRETTLTTEEAP